MRKPTKSGTFNLFLEPSKATSEDVNAETEAIADEVAKDNMYDNAEAMKLYLVSFLTFRSNFAGGN